ncbi:thiamine pyrophosphate-dependent dehydrogenase E1 component subunit alpha [Jeotgalicoccus halotolerans]|uniref:2-oxoisovalerate dehydrogenase subunit alpha n=1 Tax=Jeotgalicoccus halotolerans TaxID=157227 RepID=A0A3E0B138_9STAP|nr:thiamine pyrophosphate-dependent dehydrogenase E1 component subunit alpha [Jeotgalicoccus halotolerans]REG25657.1 branched-chain alpha-keto acid dehydrogenase E1 component [Jeotgalicoccus halotolerans]
MLSHKETDLSETDLQEMYRTMLLSRRLDERMWLLNRAGKLPFVISCQGQEATQVGAAFALDKDVDIINPYYRDLALVTHFGMTPEETMLSAFARGADVQSGGRQMPGHFSKKASNIMTQGSAVTTQIPHAVGASYVFKMNGEKRVSLATLGEGSTSQGDFHEGLNFAGVHKLPFICLIENNKYAISVPVHLQYGADKLSDRAVGYGMHGEQVDGNDPIAVYKVMKEARDRAVNGEGASLIEAMSIRLTPHSSDDDDKYREADELQKNKKDDCLESFKLYLLEEKIIDEAWLQTVEAEIKDTVNKATKAAEAAPYAAPEHTLKHVYEEVNNG